MAIPIRSLMVAEPTPKEEASAFAFGGSGVPLRHPRAARSHQPNARPWLCSRARCPGTAPSAPDRAPAAARLSHVRPLGCKNLWRERLGSDPLPDSAHMLAVPPELEPLAGAFQMPR